MVSSLKTGMSKVGRKAGDIWIDEEEKTAAQTSK
jgi:hypothetical protein